MNDKITLDQARKVLEVVDAGLCSGIGKPVPGQMCVEAAVCYALGQPHGDEPKCVNAAVRRFKIGLNDAKWSSNQARAQGMRRLAIAQLGTNDLSFDQNKFVEVLVDQTIRKIVPHALRSASKVIKDKKHKAALEEASVRCEREGNLEAAKNAREAADAAYAYTNASSAAYDVAYAASVAYAAYASSVAYASSAAYDVAYAASVAYAATAANADADAGDAVLNMSVDIGVQALRAAGAHGIELMDQLILVSDATRAAIDSAMENKL